MPQALRYANVIVPIRTRTTSRSAGKFVPVCFSRMPDEALSGLPLYMRSLDPTGRETFTLYAGAGVKFTPEQRQRLQAMGMSFIHILAEDQPKLRRQLEDKIEDLADDSAIELGVRCEIIYESGLELIDESFTTRNLTEAVPRLRRVARSIVSLYEEDAKAFGHFFAAARHDSYASTHAGNAAVWLPALAMELGEAQPTSLISLCLGASLYDIGITYVPSSVLQHPRKLNAGERQQVQQHPEMGAQLLRQVPNLDPVAAIMALQHQERLDGSGYPRKLNFEQIHHAARMVAVIDTFDALTSFRLYRKHGISPAAAVATLQRETPHHYDPRVVEAWTKLLRGAYPELFEETIPQEELPRADGVERRMFERFGTKCPAMLRTLTLVSGAWAETATVKAVAHNLSRGGLGLLSRTQLNLGEYFRAQLQTKDGLARTLTGVVMHSRDRGDGWFEAGTRFVDLEQEAAPPTQDDYKLPASVPDADPSIVAGEFVAMDQL